MELYKIFFLLIILNEISSQDQIVLSSNDFKKINNMKANESNTLKFSDITGHFYITILSLNKNAQIYIDNINIVNMTNSIVKNETNMVLLDIKENQLMEGEQLEIEFYINQDADVEITNVVENNTCKYELIEYKMDSELQVKQNNFVIFLEDNKKYEKFDLKFNFKDESKIKNEKVHYGFIYLPTDKIEYIALAKNYNDLNLKTVTFEEAAKQIEVENPYFEKEKDGIKQNFAFIFSVDNENKSVGEFSFTINSEIINIFLIVSIIIALIFAVITFFLIRRKQTSESVNIENQENFVTNDKKEEKEENGNKEEATEN